MSGKGGSSTAAARLTYRQRSAQLLGWAYVAASALLAIGIVSSWSREPNPAFLAWLLVGLGWAWALFLRPRVEVTTDGVILANVVRDVTIPWPLVEDVRTRWNLEVFTHDRGYTAWAISTQVTRPRSALAGGPFGMLGGRRSRGLRSDDPDSAMGGGSAKASSGVTSKAVAEVIARTSQEHAEAVASGVLPRPVDPSVALRWQPLPIAALVVPLVVAFAIIWR